MALHEELNSMLRHGQRECLHLNGLIRKLKSGQVMLMMKRDKAKKELEVYVNQLSESLIEFRSEMYVSIQTELDKKIKEITSLREKYETDINSYMELCVETEKLVQFGRSINNETDKHKAEQLLNEFSQLLKVTSDSREIDALMKLEFYPALPADSIMSSMFGDLIRGASPKLKKSSLSALSARKSRLDNDQNSGLDKSDKSVEVMEKIDQYTQTENVREQNSSDVTCVADNQGRSHDLTRYSPMQCSQQQYVSYPQTSPPGFEYVTMPYCTYESYSSHNPPPGFSVYQRPGAPQSYQLAGVPGPNMQVNSCMFANVPLYQDSQFNQSYTALASPTVSYQVQNAPLYQCNRSVSPESACIYQTQVAQQHYTPPVRKSCAIPITSPNADSKGKNIQKDKDEKIESGKLAASISLSQPEVQNIPLPMGPAPKENTVGFGNRRNEHLKQASSVGEKTCVKVLDLGDGIVPNERDNEIEFTEKHVEKYSKDNPSVTEKSGIKAENEECCSEKAGCLSDIQRFEKLLEKTTKLTELLESSNIDEIEGTQRTDESVEIDTKKWSFKHTIDLIQDKSTSNHVTNSDEVSRHKVVEIHKLQIDQMLSNIGQELKEKLAKGEEIISPMRPLRRPLRLPKNYRAEPKSKADSETASISDSISSIDSGFIAKEHTDKSCAETVGFISNNLKIKPEKSELEQDKEQVIGDFENVTDEYNKIQVSETLHGPDVLDLSASSGVNLRDVAKNQSPSKREIRELNKETLQSQTKWLKGYLKQMLPDNKKDVNLKKCDDNNNGVKETLFTEPETNEGNVEIGTKAKADVEDVTSFNAEEANAQNIVNDIAANEFSDSYLLTEKVIKTENEGKEHEKLEDTTSGTKQTDKENSDTNKGSAADRKADLKNLKSAVKGFLGGQKDANQRCAKTYSRLGALQAHWLKHSSGKQIEAKFLFKCSHDMHFPIGVTTNSLQQIIVADTGNHCVKLFDQNGKFIRVFGGDAMCRPSAIVVNEFDHIFVKDDVSIKVFDNLGDFIMNIATDFSKPFGLVLTPAKCLLVLETDRRHPALVHVSQDGSQVWRFPYTPLLKAPPGSKCRFMAVSENNVVVSDLGLSQIYITNLEGIFFKVIGCYGHGIMQFQEPSGISVDNYGNIVIGDSRNNRIQVFRHDGSFTGLIDFDDKIVRPSGVHLTSDNKLIVVNFLQHVVKVYQLLA
ncbi:uncharacterized protein LOC123547410 [Mercenaria mercenaria]|uniref:uncharacterized protein LOC123547410 n=1 Tax=Mercenaria mercenaria TaxID=6596 RepID=UPI00234EA1AC|nr:uncharacterized protein LOC123547410 [Mercenaria mercenaria]